MVGEPGEPKVEATEELEHSKIEHAVLALAGDDKSWDKLFEMGLESKSGEALFSMLEEDPDFAKIVELCVRYLEPNHLVSTEEAQFLAHWGVITTQLMRKIGELGKRLKEKIN